MTRLLTLCLVALCAAACHDEEPRRAIMVPSVYPVAQKLDSAKGNIAQAKAAAVQVKLSLAQNRPEEAGAGVDTLTVSLLAAETDITEGQARLADLQVQNEKLAVVANDNADKVAVAKSETAIANKKTEKAVTQRNRFALLSGSLLAWIFRRQLLALGKLIARLCGIPIP